MTDHQSTCERIHLITQAPMVLSNAEGEIHGIWPDMPKDYLNVNALGWVISDFSLQKRDALHPLITYVDPGYFLGVCQLTGEEFAILGLVSQIPHTRKEITAMCKDLISPGFLHQYVDIMMKTPLLSLEQVRQILILMVQLSHGKSIPAENIAFNDLFLGGAQPPNILASELFSWREEAGLHAPINYGDALCDAVENGSKEDLMRLLYSPARGLSGKMSRRELQQKKYEAVSLVTLLSRAAIRGGLQEEVSFRISDAFCQRIDQVSDNALIQRLVVTMLTTYCDKVKEAKQGAKYSVLIQKCIRYISVHLHENISLEELSKHCCLCGRSLSIRFRKEVGMSIGDYIHSEKIQEAKYMLRHTGYPLSEISSFLNYPSQSYFTQVFKRYTGTTPQQFREHTN